jgi:hypothetical protein
LVRPHPRPDDLDPAIHAINHWAVAHATGVGARAAKDLPTAGRQLRDASLRHWRELLHQPLHYSTLPNPDREALTWDLLVIIWQVIGRLVRGGVDARIYFCDAAFAPHAMAGEAQPDRVTDSLLVGMQVVLAPYLAAAIRPTVTTHDRAVAQALYGPLFAALTALTQTAPADSGVKGGTYAAL